MYECERNSISNPGDDMMSLGNSSFAPFLRFSSCGASSLPIQVTPSSALTKSQKSSQNTRIARDLRLSLQDSKCFRAFYLARGRHLRASKILVLLAKNHKTKLKIPAFLRGHCTLPSLNSSLGNQFAQSNTAKRSFFRKQEQAAVSLVNTRIVDSQVRDSYTNSESTTCHSEAIAEESINHTSRDISNFRPQYDKRLESDPRANLESPVDSEPTSAVGQYPTAIKIKSCVAPESRQLSGVQKSETRRAVVPRRRFLARSGNSEALPLIAEKKKRSFILFGAKGSGEGITPFSFCDTRFKESIESKEVKNEDSEKADLESQTTKNKDSQLDSKTMDCHAGLAPARNDKNLESKPLVSRINSHSTILESTSNAHIKAHSLYFTHKRGYYA